MSIGEFLEYVAIIREAPRPDTSYAMAVSEVVDLRADLDLLPMSVPAPTRLLCLNDERKVPRGRARGGEPRRPQVLLTEVLASAREAGPWFDIKNLCDVFSLRNGWCPPDLQRSLVQLVDKGWLVKNDEMYELT